MQGPLDRRERRQEAAREDVGLDPVRPAQLRLVGDVREGDRLEAHPAARPQRPVAGLEERREVLGADRLEHLDRDDGVVRALDRRGSRAARRSTRSARPAARTRSVASACWAGEIVIGGHAAAELAGGVQREAAPAGADLEDVHRRRRSPARSAMTAVLAPLGVGERLVRRVRRRRSSRSSSRRGTGGRSRCRGRSGPRCCGGCPAFVLRRARWARVRRSRERQRATSRAGSASASRLQRGQLEQGGQVRARPQAVHVRLAGADVAAEQHPPTAAACRGRGSPPRRSRRGSPNACRLPVRQDDGQLADPDPVARRRA